MWHRSLKTQRALDSGGPDSKVSSPLSHWSGQNEATAVCCGRGEAVQSYQGRGRAVRKVCWGGDTWTQPVHRMGALRSSQSGRGHSRSVQLGQRPRILKEPFILDQDVRSGG